MKMAQYRYYGENNPLNFPDTMLKEESGKILCPTFEMLRKYNQIIRLTVTTIPGTLLHIYYDDKDNHILDYVIGSTGILDIDMTSTPISLKGITIDPMSVEILKNNPDNYFIITIIY